MSMNDTGNGNDDKIIDKIRGLLAKAEATEFEDEAEAFFDKATELMAKYRIDEAMLAAAGKAADDPIERVNITIGKWANAKGVMVVGLCEAFDCHAIWSNKKQGILSLVGHKSDLEVVRALCTSLELQLDRQLQHVQGHSTGSTRAKRASFAYGWCGRVSSRIKTHYGNAVQQETEKSGESASVAVVLASREDQVAAKYQEFYGRKPRYTRGSYRASSASSYMQGASAGERADIGQGRVTSGVRGSITS